MGHWNKKSNLVLALVVALAPLVGCSGGGSEFPEVEGWTQPGEVLVYDADTTSGGSRT